MTPTATARNDQARAAVRHAETVIRDVAARNGSDVYEGFRIPWVREQVAVLFRALADGTARVCRHVGPDRPPQPLFAAAWDPGRLACAPCVDRLPAPDPVADATCDRCGRVVQPIYPGVVRVGMTLLSWGLCRRCVRATGMPMHPGSAARGGR